MGLFLFVLQIKNMNRKSQKQPGFSSVADIIRDKMTTYSKGQLTQTMAFQKRWPDLVGQQIARYSKVLHLNDDQLIVAVESSTWHNELQLLSQHVLRHINADQDLPQVKKLVFKIQKLND